MEVVRKYWNLNSEVGVLEKERRGWVVLGRRLLFL